jgi:hypothetical protein
VLLPLLPICLLCLVAGNFGHCVMTSNNDCCVRLFDVEGCRPRQRLPFGFAVNYATLRPAGAAPGGGAVAAVVGDDPLTWLIDLRCGLQVSGMPVPLSSLLAPYLTLLRV